MSHLKVSVSTLFFSLDQLSMNFQKYQIQEIRFKRKNYLRTVFSFAPMIRLLIYAASEKN